MVSLIQNLGYVAKTFLNDALPTSGHPKIELYELSTLVIDWSFKRIYAEREQRPPYGLVKLVESEDSFTSEPAYELVDSFESDKPFSELKKYMTATLHRGLREQLHNLDRMVMDPLSTDPIKETYARFKILLERYQNLNSNKVSAYDFIESGLNTAIETMTGILEIIPVVYKREFEDDNPDAYAQIAQNSLILINRLASQHLDNFVYLIDKIRKKSSEDGFFDPKYFDIDKMTNRLTIKNTRKTVPDYIHSIFRDFKTYSPREGCPAMKNICNTSVIRNLWVWYVEISEMIYKKMRQSES